jgi:hypothetical protein
LSTGRVNAVSRPSIAFLLFCLASACSKKIPERWAKLGMPSQDLHEVREETNEDRFSADYKGSTPEQLTARVENALVAAGYAPACNQFEGRVRGYARGEDRLLVKVDSIGPVIALSVGNKQGADRLLYGICFEGYQLGEPVRVK